MEDSEEKSHGRALVEKNPQKKTESKKDRSKRLSTNPEPAIFGPFSRSFRYFIPQIHIGKVDASPFLAIEEDLKYLTYGSSPISPKKPISKLKKKRLARIQGHLGLGTFAQTRLLSRL